MNFFFHWKYIKKSSMKENLEKNKLKERERERKSFNKPNVSFPTNNHFNQEKTFCFSFFNIFVRNKEQQQRKKNKKKLTGFHQDFSSFFSMMMMMINNWINITYIWKNNSQHNRLHWKYMEMLWFIYLIF